MHQRWLESDLKFMKAASQSPSVQLIVVLHLIWLGGEPWRKFDLILPSLDGSNTTTTPTLRSRTAY
jgi:hypothetical protein